MSIPVVYILPEFTGKDTLLRLVFLFIITRPAINNVIMLFHSGRMDIGSSYRTSRIGIFFFGNLKSLQGKIERIAGFIQDGFPHQYGRVITVTTNHFAGILMNQLPEFRIFVPVLPSRSSDNHEQAELVTGIHKGRVLGIVGYPNNGTSGITQTFGVTPLL